MVERIKLSTRDQDEAVPVLEQYFTGVRMTTAGEAFSFDITAADTGGLTQLDFRLLSPQSASSVLTDDEVIVGQVPEGRLSLVDEAGREIDTSLPWLYPRGRVEGHWDEVGMRVLFLPKEELRRFVAAATGRSARDFEFTGATPTPERARAWSSLVAVTVAELQNADPLVHSPIAESARMTHLMMGLVSTFPNTLSAEGTGRDTARIEPSAVRRALIFMEDNAHLPITVIEVAEAARLSVRGLQYAFHEHLQTTPMAFLRSIRLERVHVELIIADPSQGATVRAIAQAWGFAHLGRFAQHYQEVYGETPRATLERG